MNALSGSNSDCRHCGEHSLIRAHTTATIATASTGSSALLRDRCGLPQASYASRAVSVCRQAPLPRG